MKYTQFLLVMFTCASFILAAFYVGKWNQPKASSHKHLVSQIPYKIIAARESNVWLTNNDTQQKRLLTGMIVTTASTNEEYELIAQQIQYKFKNKNLDSIELTVHNPNDRTLEEDIEYMPVSKAVLKISYTSLGQEELQLPRNQNYLIEINQ
ncbi:hypothetical protein [Bacillus sp. 165]|uniref:hypothetical protein n=1 Tax=Bacillus sp. 165 TaxID=1529117 RepID=UPI001ADD3CF7|nr:hypothetical protein [Bacillus sp. 165]MBO9128316.1 hypothetical protein [Bacillus sp. 165]